MMMVRGLIVTLVLLILWQCITTYFAIPHYLLPSPSAILMRLWQDRMLLMQEAIPTILETLLGLGCGIALGMIAGILIASISTLKRWLLPLIITSQAIPSFVIAPLLVIWLGYDLSAKIMMATIMVFFPVCSACLDGLCSTKQNYLQLAKQFHATPLRLFWYIRLPAALPRLASACRIAATIAPMGAIIGEWVGASTGLGYLMLIANARMESDLLFAALSVVVLLAILLYYLMDVLLAKLIWWDTRS